MKVIYDYNTDTLTVIFVVNGLGFDSENSGGR
jgi:hypothetical protein